MTRVMCAHMRMFSRSVITYASKSRIRSVRVYADRIFLMLLRGRSRQDDIFTFTRSSEPPQCDRTHGLSRVVSLGLIQ